MVFAIFESQGVVRTECPKNCGIAAITHEQRRDTRKTVNAVSFADARRKAAQLCPGIDANKLRVVIA